MKKPYLKIKNKSFFALFVFSAFLFLFFAWPSFAAVSYSRVPEGLNPSSPVKATFTYGGPEDFSPGSNYWQFDLRANGDYQGVSSNCLASSTLTYTLVADVPGSNFWRSIVQEYADPECRVPTAGVFSNEEVNIGDPIFTVDGSGSPLPIKNSSARNLIIGFIVIIVALYLVMSFLRRDFWWLLHIKKFRRGNN